MQRLFKINFGHHNKLRRCLHLRSYSSFNISDSSKKSRNVIFSLIQPTGQIHLGNYLGAVRGWKEISVEHKDSLCIFGTADLHALTVPKDAKLLQSYRRQAIASLLASGLSQDNCIIYHQSSVPEHSELAWILTCLTSIGALNRMTQWKSKSSQSDNSSIYDENTMGKTKAGVLCYPVLQAADILLYKATHVPVGDDQIQHLELCRSIAGIFNHTYKKNYFELPQTILSPTKKILSLRNPTKKMSKSDPDQNSCLFLTDSPEIIRRKLAKAVTDSVQGPITYDVINRPGISNLVDILSGLSMKPVEDVIEGISWIKDHKQFKDYISDVIIEDLTDYRQRYSQLIENPDFLDSICKNGTERAREIASTNLAEIKHLVGLT